MKNKPNYKYGHTPLSYLTQKYITISESKYSSKNLDYLKDLDSEAEWQKFFFNSTPMGGLLKNNSLFETVKQKKGLTLIHITYVLDKIEESGYLYPSGGALGACTYGVPLREDNSLHNLSDFILRHELPQTLKTRGIPDKNIGILAIEIDQNHLPSLNKKAIGIDYVQFGKLRIEAFNNIIKNKLIPDTEVLRLNEIFRNRKQDSLQFLEICNNTKSLEKIDISTFEKSLFDTLNKVTALRTIYFEALLEYVMLFQNDKKSLIHKERGELYNWHSKEMIYDLCPELFKNFKLTVFNPKLSDVANYIRNKSKNSEIIIDFSPSHFFNFMTWRIAHCVRFKILDSERIATDNQSFFGHVIHREILYVREYEQELANILWQYWNANDILIPVYAALPKGEMGVNPTYKNLQYEIYKLKVDKFGNIQDREQTKIKIMPKIMDPKLGIMRAPHKKEY